MRRREFIAVVACAVASPLAARAQQSLKPVIGYLGTASVEDAPDWFAGFRAGLNTLGLREERDVAIEYRATGGKFERYSEFANDLVKKRVDIIFASDNAGALAAKRATTTIPVVFAIGGDPVALGLVASMNRPGRNVTGVSFLSTTIMAKRLELLQEAVPDVPVIAALINPTNTNATADTAQLKQAAQYLGLELHILLASKESEIDDAFSKLGRMPQKALVIEGDGFFAGRNSRLVGLTARYAVPAIHPNPATAKVGGLMSYGASLPDAYRIAGTYVGRILKGEKPSDLPVQQSTKVEMLINLKTAKALGMKIPATLVSRADDVIE